MGYQARSVGLETPSEQASTAGTSTQAPSSASRTQPSSHNPSSQGTNKPVIRMVSMYHMGDQPTSFPEEFDMSEDSEEVDIEYFGRVLKVEGELQEESGQENEFWAGEESDEEFQDCVEFEQDLLYQWYSGEDVQEPVHYVRPVGVDKAKDIEVVLDSGADISLAPLWIKKYEKRAPEKAKIVLRDAKGTGSRFRIRGSFVLNLKTSKETR